MFWYHKVFFRLDYTSGAIRYALSYLPVPNANPYCYIHMAFIALDTEKLGERPDDKIQVDFGENKFPHYLGTS